MLWLIPALLFVIIIVLDRWLRRKELQMYDKLKPDWSCYPLIGHGHHFIGKAEDRMTTIQKCGEETTQLGGIVAAWMGRRLFVIITDPVIADVVMKTCLQKDELLDLVSHVTGNGSLFSRVHIWRPRRKTIAPIFCQKNLYQFVDVFNAQSSIMIEEIGKVAGTGPFSVWRYLTSYAMDSVCETTLGLKMHVQKNPNQPFLKTFEEWCELSSTRLLTPWLHLDVIFKLMGYQKRYYNSIHFMWQFIMEIIQKKRQFMEAKYKDNNNTLSDEGPQTELRTVLEILLDPSNAASYSDEWLREEILVLVLAGTDTSAVGASFVTMMLASHADVQEKVYQEIVEVIGAGNGPIAPEELSKLKYLDAVIRESLRLYPPAPAVLRTVEQDLMLPSGTTLVKGCGVMLNIWAVNRNPNYWGSDADTFRPERFLENSSRHPAAFMSFSYGPRGCVGYRYAMLSLKTAIANMVRNFRILPENYSKTQGFTNPPEEKPLRLKFGIMMKDVNNFRIQLETRN